MESEKLKSAEEILKSKAWNRHIAHIDFAKLVLCMHEFHNQFQTPASGESKYILVFQHHNGESLTSREYTALELLETSEDEIRERTCICDCQPVGETYVVECNCSDYYDEFVFDKIIEAPWQSSQPQPNAISVIEEYRDELEITVKESLNQTAKKCNQYALNLLKDILTKLKKQP